MNEEVIILKDKLKSVSDNENERINSLLNENKVLKEKYIQMEKEQSELRYNDDL